MTKPVRAILIDPFACTVSDVETDADDHRDLYRLLSHETMTVDLFDRCYFDGLAERDALFFDDEGLLKPCARFFTIVSKSHQRPVAGPLAGKGIVIGADGHGHSQAAATPLKYIAERAQFYDHRGNGNLFRTHRPFIYDGETVLPDAMM